MLSEREMERMIRRVLRPFVDEIICALKDVETAVAALPPEAQPQEEPVNEE